MWLRRTSEAKSATVYGEAKGLVVQDVTADQLLQLWRKHSQERRFGAISYLTVGKRSVAS